MAGATAQRPSVQIRKFINRHPLTIDSNHMCCWLEFYSHFTVLLTHEGVNAGHPDYQQDRYSSPTSQFLQCCISLLSLVMTPTPDAVPIFRYRENILPMDTVKQQVEGFSRQAVEIFADRWSCSNQGCVRLPPGCSISHIRRRCRFSSLVSLSGCTTSAPLQFRAR